MRLRVHCQEWMLGDRGYGAAVGDSFSDWLVLHCDEGWPTELVSSYEALVAPLPAWEGLSFGCDAYRLDIGSAPVYCERGETLAPGRGKVRGVLSVDTYLAPPDWPVTRGVVVRLWTEHRWYVQEPKDGGTWVFESADARYEEVTRCGALLDGGPEPHVVRREACTGVLLEVDVERPQSRR